MKKNIKNNSKINNLQNCICDNDSYFQRSDEQFRTKLNDTEFSKDFNHEAEDIESRTDYSIYDYDIENNKGHEWRKRK